MKYRQLAPDVNQMACPVMRRGAGTCSNEWLHGVVSTMKASHRSGRPLSNPPNTPSLLTVALAVAATSVCARLLVVLCVSAFTPAVTPDRAAACQGAGCAATSPGPRAGERAPAR